MLKLDISAARLRAISPLIGGIVGVDYLRSAFSTRNELTIASSFVEVSNQLPKTVIWFTEALRGLEQEKTELETSLAPVHITLLSMPLKPPGTGIPPLSMMRTGGRFGVSTRVATALPSGESALSFAGLSSFLPIPLYQVNVVSFKKKS